MRRSFAGVILLLVVGSAVLAAGPATLSTSAPATSPATAPASRPTSEPTSGPASQPTTRSATTKTAANRQAEIDKRREDNLRKAEEAKLTSALTNIAGDADAAKSEISSISARFTADSVTSQVDADLPPWLSEITAGLADNERLLSSATSLETLRSKENEWNQYDRTLSEWSSSLKRRDVVLKDGTDRLGDLIDTWRGLRNKTEDASKSPDVVRLFNPDVIQQFLQQINAVIDQATTLQEYVNWEHDRANNLLITMQAAQIRVRSALGAVHDAQTKARDKLLSQDSPPLWSALIRTASVQQATNVAEQGRNSLTNQWQVLKNYVSRQKPNFLLHLAGVLTLAAGLIWLRRQTRQWVAGDPTLAEATRVFQTPIATAITASMILTPWIYPAAPRLFWGIVGTSALLPTIMVLRPLIERSLRPLLYGLAGASFVNLLLSIVAGLPLVYRLLFLGQMGGAALFFIWFLRTGRRVPGDASGQAGRPPLRKAAIVGARFGLAVTVIAFAANVFGYVALSRLMGSALLTSAYLGVLLDTSIHVVDALLLGASHIRPINTLGMVQRHRPLLLKRLHLLLSVLAIGLWGFFTLDALSIRQQVFANAKAVWAFPKDVDQVFETPAAKASAAARQQAAVDVDTAPPATQAADVKAQADKAAAAAAVSAAQAKVAVETADNATLTNSLYIGGLINFALVLTASFYTSRFIAFLLDEDIYPRMHLPRGMPYAISTLLRYVILAIGFTLAIAKLGYNDMTKLTILVSAFGVGLGFGMQNIVNNFVSGLILLFERPVQVGDVIELDNVTGVITRIGIRASVIRTPLAAEIIIPNGRLISDRVVNWTLSNRQRGMELSLTVAAGTEPQRLIQQLAATAKAHPLVAAYPSPQAFFTDFKGGGMEFEVRAWTNRFEDWTQVRSELAVAINAMLVKENVTLKG